MIKPEGVPESLVENYADRFSLAYWDGSRGEHVAEFLNAAIEAGVVSPPCYTIRNQQDGRLFHDVGQVRLRPGKPQIPAHEHWKGQTE